MEEKSSLLCLETVQEKVDITEPVLAILGNGNYGKALATRFHDCGFSVIVGSRDPSRRKFLPGEIKVETYQSAAEKCAVAFVCIPVDTYDSLIPNLQGVLADKIVVDISNPPSLSAPCGALHLSSLLPRSHIVKALNTISAWTLENDSYGASKETYVCSEDSESRTTVIQLLQEVGLTPVDCGKLKVAKRLEQLPLKLFPEWRVASWITCILTLFCIFYYYLRVFGAERKGIPEFKKVALYHANRIVCWIALWLFSLVYLPGCLAGFLQIYNGSKYKAFPSWLDRWMKSRKQLGLIALLLAAMHACLSLITLAVEQVHHMSKYVQVPGTNAKIFQNIVWNGEPSLLFATIALTAFGVLGVTSLPSVNARMSWKEWNFVQSKIGYTGLFFATAHVLIYAFSVFDPNIAFKYWKWKMPPAVFLQPLLPALVMVLKLVLSLPGVSGYLTRIRLGWERNIASETKYVSV